jgi:hypothetical protein
MAFAAEIAGTGASVTASPSNDQAVCSDFQEQYRKYLLTYLHGVELDTGLSYQCYSSPSSVQSAVCKARKEQIKAAVTNQRRLLRKLRSNILSDFLKNQDPGFLNSCLVRDCA